MTVERLALLPDSELIDACLGGNSQAWEALLIRYQRLVYSVPIRYGFPEHDANDIFQNVSILLFDNLAKLRDRERLGAWLVITTRRECWRMFRRRPGPDPNTTSEAVELDDQTPGAAHVEDDFLTLERQSLVRAAVETLGDPCRKLITLLFYTDPRPDYSTVAQELAISEGSIGPTRARCLGKLMNILEKQGLSEL